MDGCYVSADWGGHGGAVGAAVDRGVDEGVLVEDGECGVVLGEDLADACREDHLDIGQVPEDDPDRPESCVCFWEPCLVELVIVEFEDAGVDALDADAHS